MYGSPYMNVSIERPSDDHACLVLRGVSPCDLRKNALCECERRLGTQGWRVTGEQITPCMRSLGGRVLLYEGRFEASRA